eukprot:Phypoly_transcript_04895.p1 GENE.Phypoly_transcript_04895~~Phypoly_transcript_04895.p1  ORF type:complete len:649 (+),score=73.19 Phypoly_transcript_04895:97-2043(+)
MTELQGELENIRLFRDTIKSSLGPNGLNKLLFRSVSGKILPTNTSIYEVFFSTTNTLQHSQKTNDPPPNSKNTHTTNSENTNNSQNTNNVINTGTITTMVSVLLKAQQHMMLDGCKDGSTSVVLLACSFLDIGFRLHFEGISRNKISEIFQKGLLLAMDILQSIPTKKVTVNWCSLFQAQKIYEMVLGHKHTTREYTSLLQLLAKATTTVALSLKREENETVIVDSIRLCPCVGGDVSTSTQISGLVFPFTPISSQKSITTRTHIALFGIPLQGHQTKMNLVATLASPQVLKQWQKEEEQILKDIAMQIIKAGAKIIISSGQIHKYILHWFDLHKLVAVQSVPKSDLISLAKASGAKLIYQTRFFDQLDFGVVNSFEIIAILGEDYSHVNVAHTVSLLIRGSTRHKTMQLIKCCHDALAIVREMKPSSGSSSKGLESKMGIEKRAEKGMNKMKGVESVEKGVEEGVEDSVEEDAIGNSVKGEITVICGGGIPEMTVATQLPLRLLDFDPLEQHVLSNFASGFEVIPKCLLENSGAPNHSFELLKAQYENGKTNTGVTKTGAVAVFDIKKGAVYDFLDVKKHIWCMAVDVASLLLVSNSPCHLTCFIPLCFFLLFFILLLSIFFLFFSCNFKMIIFSLFLVNDSVMGNQ